MTSKSINRETQAEEANIQNIEHLFISLQEDCINEEWVKVIPSSDEEDPLHQSPMEAVSKIKVLEMSLQHYKFQNEYLNDSNDKLMQANRRLREDLEEINGHYRELIMVSKESYWKKNEELVKKNKDILDKIQVMETEHVQ